MGKASSAKKIARAARAGAATGPNERRELGFPALVIGVVVAGLLLVGFARSTRDAQAQPTLQDHWHSAYSLYDCASDTNLPPFDSQYDPLGIHSHTDSLIHVHPFTAEVTGSGARMGVFLETMGATVTPEVITLPGGETLEAGVDCGGVPSIVAIGRWENGLDPTGAPDEVYTDDFDDIVFTGNAQAFTIGRFASVDDIPPPPADVIDTLLGSQGLSRDEGVEPPNTSARPGPQDFGTDSGATDGGGTDGSDAQSDAGSTDGSTDTTTDSGDTTDPGDTGTDG